MIFDDKILIHFRTIFLICTMYLPRWRMKECKLLNRKDGRQRGGILLIMCFHPPTLFAQRFCFQQKPSQSGREYLAKSKHLIKMNSFFLQICYHNLWLIDFFVLFFELKFISKGRINSL